MGHDGLKTSVGLDLSAMFDTAKSLWMASLKTQDKHKAFPIKFWIDFKNLDDSNKELALETMKGLCEKYQIPIQNLIIESPNYKALRVFRDGGFFTSYYFPYYDMQKLETDRAEIKTQLQDIIKTGNVNAISFDYEYYDFIESLHLKYKHKGKMQDMPLLTWNIGGVDKDWIHNLQTKAYEDPRVKVILVSEQGNYR